MGGLLEKEDYYFWRNYDASDAARVLPVCAGREI